MVRKQSAAHAGHPDRLDCHAAAGVGICIHAACRLCRRLALPHLNLQTLHPVILVCSTQPDTVASFQS
eukprot:5997206-Amphidinium_carterae.1